MANKQSCLNIKSSGRGKLKKKNHRTHKQLKKVQQKKNHENTI